MRAHGSRIDGEGHECGMNRWRTIYCTEVVDMGCLTITGAARYGEPVKVSPSSSTVDRDPSSSVLHAVARGWP